MEHPNPLLERETGSGIRLHQWLVSHEEGAHHLKDWDLNREVEWSNNTNWA